MNRVYHVRYKMHPWDLDEGIDILACNKEEAYDYAVYEAIPDDHGSLPYSAWVESVTYQNGNCRNFNTSEGNPY